MSALNLFTIIFLLLYFLVLAVLMAYTAVIYVLQGVGLFRMARKCDLPRPWLSWIPYGNTWIIGAVADHANEYTRRKKTKFRVWLLAAMIVLSAISVVGGGIIGGAIGVTFSMAGPSPSVEDTGFMTVFIITMAAYLLFLGLIMLLSVAQTVLLSIALYRVFTLFEPNKGKVWFWLTAGTYIGGMTVLPILSFFVGLVQGIALLILSKNDPHYPDPIPVETVPTEAAETATETSETYSL